MWTKYVEITRKLCHELRFMHKALLLLGPSKSILSLFLLALSGGKVVTDVGSKFTGGLPHHMEQPLRARVWGYGDSVSSRKGPHQGQGDQLFTGCSIGDMPITLLE